MITNQKALRAAFWERIKEIRPEWMADFHRSKKQNDYKTSIRVAWVDFVGSIERDGQISEKLAFRATL